MSKFIGIELLAANALIDIIEKTGCRTIALPTLDDYTVKLSDIFEKNNKEQIVIIYNTESADNRFLDYPEIFEDNNNTVSIRRNVSTDELRKEFRTPLSCELTKAILNDEVRGVALSACNQ